VRQIFKFKFLTTQQVFALLCKVPALSGKLLNIQKETPLKPSSGSFFIYEEATNWRKDGHSYAARKSHPNQVQENRMSLKIEGK